jgi:ANTAR domain.
MTAKSAILAQLVRVVASETSDQPLPVRLCLASSAILGADGAAVTLCYTETTRLTVCATDEIAARLEDLQDVLGEGPGPDAYITGRMIRATLGERAARRWPAFAAAAHAELGPMAISAIPIQPGIDVLGVLTLYQYPARPLEKDPTVAQFVADTLGAALLRDGGLQEDLGNGPWSSQAQVHQAAGMVIAQLGVGPEDALALLRAHAYADGASMAVIARAVVERRLDFSREDDSREIAN